jgi:hypothetical protein
VLQQRSPLSISISENALPEAAADAAGTGNRYLAIHVDWAIFDGTFLADALRQLDSHGLIRVITPATPACRKETVLVAAPA